jgi:hypothetical protein
MGGSLGAYVIGLSREHQSSTEEGLTLWERLECDLIPFESSGISVGLLSSLQCVPVDPDHDQQVFGTLLNAHGCE